jgi:adenosylcobinamide-phosphate synthase
MLISADALWVLALALAIDALVGDPDWLWRRWPHPVVWFGRIIGWLDRRLNLEMQTFAKRRALGVLALALVLCLFAGGAALLHVALDRMPLGWLLEALIASVLIAQRSLHDHVLRVAVALETGGVQAGREAVSMIVGRDPLSLDEAGIARAAIESTAENFSDGVVAPALWFALLGLPGLVAYKVINTADSMIGHMSERHRAFGWAAARLDDLVNLPASRLAGILLSAVAPLAGQSAAVSLQIMLRDAGLHRSPNAGWPEAAMAAALGLRLAGPRSYGGKLTDDPPLNAGGRADANAADIRNALRVMSGGCASLMALVLAGAALAIAAA